MPKSTNDLKVTISGPFKSGKSTVAQVLKTALEEFDVIVELHDKDDEGDIEYAPDILNGRTVKIFMQSLRLEN